MKITPADVVKRSIPVPESGCWIWLLYSGNHGYGVATVKRKAVLAHRVSWQAHFGEIPAGALVCHRCDTPLCVNPSHLFLGTDADNMRDKTIKRRNNSPFGERHASAKLTEDQVAMAINDDRSSMELARLFGVSYHSVWAVRARKTWRHIK